jgi:two-component system chemotaxis response regulator CheB
LPAHDIIVIGASVGGVQALSYLVRNLPKDLQAAVFVTVHVWQGGTSHLPEILAHAGNLPAHHARDGEQIEHGTIYVAPQDFHLLVREGVLELSRGPRENRHRPAIDPMFRSAARAYGARVAGVILTGALNDGTAGLMAIRAAGGVAIVQDPADAFEAAMPRSAQNIAGADYIVPLRDMAALLLDLVRGSTANERNNMAEPRETVEEKIREDMEAQAANARRGHLSTFTCPECGGPLWQMSEQALVQFHCHVGHRYYGEELMAEQSEALEAALWSAVRIFREQAVLARQLAAVRRPMEPDTAARFEEDAQLADQYSGVIHSLLMRAPLANPDTKP